MTPHVSITLLRTQTDARLVELTAAGHDRAFDAIVDRYRRPLLRYARRFLPEEARAEDVVQAAFVSAWGALSDGAPVRDLRPWLYRIVHNGALTVMKKPGGDDAPLLEASDLRPGPAMEVEQREDVRQALDTIASLPDRQRAALLAVALEGRSHADVGAELGLNDTAVRQLVSRARATLRVAATAVTPWPVAAWLAGVGAPQAADTATRVGEIVGGVGAGTLFGGSALKVGAVVAAAGAVAVSVPTVDHVVRERPRPAAAQAAERSGATAEPPAGVSGPSATLISAPSTSTPTTRPSGGDSGSERSGPDEHSGSGGGRGEGSGSGDGPRSSPGGPGDDGRGGGDDQSDDHGSEQQRSGEDHSGESPRSGKRERHRSGSGGHSEDDAPEGEDTAAPAGPTLESHEDEQRATHESSDDPETSGGSDDSGSDSGSRSGSDHTETEKSLSGEASAPPAP